MDKVLAPEYKTYRLKIKGFDRQRLMKNIFLPFQLAASTIVSFNILKKHRPDVVVGLGGYPSGPFLYAAALKKIRLGLLPHSNLVADGFGSVV